MGADYAGSDKAAGWLLIHREHMTLVVRPTAAFVLAVRSARERIAPTSGSMEPLRAVDGSFISVEGTSSVEALRADFCGKASLEEEAEAAALITSGDGGLTTSFAGGGSFAGPSRRIGKRAEQPGNRSCHPTRNPGTGRTLMMTTEAGL